MNARPLHPSASAADAPRPGPDIPIIIPTLKLVIAGKQYVTDPISIVAYPEGAPRPAALPEDESAPEDKTQLGIAAKVFQLLTALDPENKIRKAPPIKVFLLRYRQNLDPVEIARRCRCDRSLIFVRLKAIEQKLPWKPHQLRELSSHVEALQATLSDSRARKIYRRGEFDEGDDD
jgi:hypothetical protein